ncbi:energy-coupling factor transporter transmembrane component T family protein [Methanocella arvoryzae]|uniref:energy-coupling factor transporter transmembrane component T family protein n=1 Tax=Methanocella arvoryzae TaxID=1175445 RepID=UPI0003237F44|nr:energy-coupling factor transporter transmembrane protein EcfT [Methanocella arvoryzae]
MKVPAIIKLIGLSVFSIGIVIIGDLRMLLACVAVLLACALLLGADISRLLKMLVPAMPFILIIALFQWLISGPDIALLSFMRMLLLYLAGSIVTITTTEAEFVRAVQALLWPVGKVTGTNLGRDIATMMVLAIAFLPIIKEEHDIIRLAQEARGVSFDGPVQYLKGEIYTIIPLVNAISARADRIAQAMEARCYSIKPER